MWDTKSINQNGIRPLQDTLEAFTKINIPKTGKNRSRSSKQHLSKCIEILSAQTDILRKFLKKQTEWIWTDENTKAFINLKNRIIQLQLQF